MVIQLVQHNILNFKISNSKISLIMTYIPKYFQNHSSYVHILISKFHIYIYIYKFNKFPGAFISPRGPVFHKKITLIF